MSDVGLMVIDTSIDLLTLPLSEGLLSNFMTVRARRRRRRMGFPSELKFWFHPDFKSIHLLFILVFDHY